MLWSLNMAKFTLPCGREIFLSRFAIAPTYTGVLEGTPKTASPYILKLVADFAAQVLPPAVPLVVVPHTTMPLPGWLCVAELGCLRGARQSDPDYSSRLYVCWFTDSTSQSIDAMVEPTLCHLNWTQTAYDYNIMDF
jgi:hypothetical protein